MEGDGAKRRRRLHFYSLEKRGTDLLLQVNRRCCLFAGVITLICLFTIFYFNITIISSEKPNTYQEGDLKCANSIKQYITQSDKYELKVKDLMTFITDYALTPNAREQFYKNQEAAVARATYFKSSRALRYRISVLVPCQQPNPHPTVAVCSYQDMTAEFAQQWVSHYVLLGVKKIFIYNGNPPGSSSDRLLRQVLQPFVSLGYVEIIEWFNDASDNTVMRENALHDCPKRAAKYDWMTFLDIEEFLVINFWDTGCINTFIALHNNKTVGKPAGAIALRYRNMVSLGFPQHNAYQTFLSQSIYSYPNVNEDVKNYMISLKGLKEFQSVHEVLIKPGYHYYDAEGNEISSSSSWNTSATIDDYFDLELRRFSHLSLEHLFFNKLCAGTKEQGDLSSQLELAFLHFEKDAKITKISASQHNPNLHGFLFRENLD